LSCALPVAWGANGTGTDGAADAPPVLEEVVVTAGKVAEPLHDVAAPITALSESRLEDLQATNFEDYAKLVPGLSLQENRPGQTVLTLQGVSSFSGGATVGVYVDDTPYGSSSGLTNGQFYTGDLNTYDMARVEVLKGPQGTLYGASTLGGLLKFVTNAPDPTRFAFDAELGTETTHSAWGWSTKAMVNLPMGDIAALRITGVHEKDPGFIDDPSRHLDNINSSEENGVRASFLVNPLDQLTVRFTAVGQDTVYNDTNAFDVRENAAGQVMIPAQPLTGDLQLSQNSPQYTHSRYRVYDATVNWDFGPATLVSATSYATLQQAAQTDYSVLGTAPPVVQITNFHLQKLTQELRLQSSPVAQPAGGELDWLAGLYFTRETAAILPQIYGTYAAIDLSLDGSYEDLASTYKEEAGFVNLTYHFTSQFDLGVGGRFAHNKQTSDQTFGGPFYAGLPPQLGDSSQGLGLYSVAPRWRPTRDTTVYARVASGFRPGGPNIYPVGLAPSGTQSSFKPDKVVSADLGVRSEWFDHRLAVDLSAFDIHWRDIQLVGSIMLSDGTTSTFTQNGGTAESRGIEWQGTFVPVSGLTLALNGAFTDAKLTQDTTANVGGLDGDPLPYVPRLTSSFDINYEFALGADTRAFAGALASYVGKQRTQFNSAVYFSQIPLDTYTTLDLRMGVRHDQWTAELFCKNATDQRGVTGLGTNESANVTADNSAPFPQTVFVIRPRTFGLNVGVRF